MNASNEDEIVPTSEELYARTSSWTLACDNLLLNKLKKFSQDLEKSSSELNEECQKLGKDAIVLHAKLHNVTNQFLALSGSQFVENRVQEFEEASTSVASKPMGSSSVKKTKAEKEAELIGKMKKAIQIGISGNSQRLQSLSQGQPKLTFPYLIGSSKFFSSRFVGLVEDELRISRDLPSNYEKSDETSAMQSSGHSITEPQLLEPITRNLHIPVSNSLPQEVSSAPSLISAEVPKTISPHSVQQPLLNKSVIIPPALSNEVPTPKSDAPVQNREKYFNHDGPPPPTIDSEDSDDDFKPIARIGGGGRLFVDDDDEDIFNDSSLFLPSRTQNSFFNTQSIIESIAPASRASPPLPPDDTNDDDIPINASEQSKSNIGRKPRAQDKVADSVKSVYQSNDQSNKGGSVTSNSKSKIPPGGVSVFGSVPPAEFAKLRTKKNAEPKHVVVDEPETQLPGSNGKCVNVSDRGSSVGTNEDQDHETTSHSSLTSRGLTSSQGSLNDPIVPVSRPKPKGIFNLDSDDDLFSSKKPLPSSSSTQGTSLNNKNSLTVDPPTSSFHRNKSSKKKLKTSIFDDSDSDDDLFSSSSSTSSKINHQQIKKPLVFPIQEQNSGRAIVSKSRATGLFDNDSDSDTDLFASKGLNVNKLNSRTTAAGRSHSNLRNKPEVCDKTNLKANTEGSDSKLPQSHSKPGIDMQTEEKEEVVVEHPAALEQLYSDQSTHSLNEGGVDEHKEMSPPASDDTEKLTSASSVNNSNVPNSDVQSDIESQLDNLTAQSGNDTKLDNDMKPPLENLGAGDAYVPGTENLDIPDNTSSLKTIDAVYGSKISQLKQKLSASEIKISPGAASDHNPSDKVKNGQQSKIGKLKDTLSFGKEEVEKPSSTDLTVSAANDKVISTEKTSKISKLKEKLSSSESKPIHDALSDKSVSRVGKPTVDVKKLALSLKINPLTMMPGAKPVKQESLESPVSEAETIRGSIDQLEDESSQFSAPETRALSEVATPVGDVDVKKLALGLNINPLAMMPGAKLVKKKSVLSPDAETLPQSPDIETPSSPNVDATSEACVQNIVSSPVDSETSKPYSTPTPPGSQGTETPILSSPVDEESPDINDPNPLLRNLSKGRARVQFKRRPPSKKLLHFCKTSNDVPEDESESISSIKEEDINPVSDTVLAETDLPTKGSNSTVNINGSLPIQPEVTESNATKNESNLSDIKSNTVAVQEAEEVPGIYPQNTQADIMSGNISTSLSVSEETEEVPEIYPQNTQVDIMSKNNSTFLSVSDDVFNKVGEKPEILQSQKSENKPAVLGSIWDDSDSDDIFATASKKSKSKTMKQKLDKPNEKSGKNALFNSRTDELPSEVKADDFSLENASSTGSQQNNETQLNVNMPENDSHIRTAVNTKEQGPSTTVEKQKQRLFSKDEQKSNEDIFKTSSPPSHSTAKTMPKTKESDHAKQNKPKHGLFESDSDEDLFKSSNTNAKTKKNTPRAKSTPTESSASKSSKPTKSSSTKSIFDDSSDEDLFTKKKI